MFTLCWCERRYAKSSALSWKYRKTHTSINLGHHTRHDVWRMTHEGALCDRASDLSQGMECDKRMAALFSMLLHVIITARAEHRGRRGLPTDRIVIRPPSSEEFEVKLAQSRLANMQPRGPAGHALVMKTESRGPTESPPPTRGGRCSSFRFSPKFQKMDVAGHGPVGTTVIADETDLSPVKLVACQASGPCFEFGYFLLNPEPGTYDTEQRRALAPLLLRITINNVQVCSSQTRFCVIQKVWGN